jgi:hypothetical protein
MEVLAADVRAHVQRLVSVVKMATVLELCITEEQRYVVRFYGQKDTVKMMFIKKCFLFTVGRICRVKGFTTWSKKSLKGFRNSKMTPDQVALL